ncbi:Uma2 family endonuclease [Lentibacillus amyloliquefaciens]|uniref:Endonuclease n=1 Tax=Lentibacillus amyloliquefaciens TaxID=1472767 RepID=A0A0U4FKD8_9BACI|nr:Uma2 family endonuclease [Lentibacillus amyloliquefaciens]ALX49118.1 endonuclease [Lentibacillus amyloliquefaciens]
MPKENPPTYSEYLQMNDDIKYEVIDGYIYNMSPSPSVKHQRIGVKISTEFDNYLRKKSCDVISEIDVSLEGVTDTTKMKDWVRPDISIICDKDKMKENYIAGAPDLIVEILSKSTAKADKMIKFNRYQDAGVKEYWIVDPAHEAVDVYLLKDGHFVHDGTYTNEETVRVGIFDNLFIDLNNIFV